MGIRRRRHLSADALSSLRGRLLNRHLSAKDAIQRLPGKVVAAERKAA
jgi:hypothetical protein